MWTEEKLNEMLTEPSEALIEDVKQIKDDVLVLGAGGKMGSSLCVLAKNAFKAAGKDNRVIAVSRFSDPIATEYLKSQGIEIIPCELMDREQFNALPDAENVIFMAGKKFGTNGDEWRTWGINATLPAFVAEKYKNSRIVVFSSGNIYPIVPIHTGGCKESDAVAPIGDYPMSVLARERAFEYGSNTYGTKVFIYRLNFAVDLRYGVLNDIATSIINGTPISLSTPVLNCIWQGSANEYAIRGLLHASSPACKMNITGPEILSIRKIAEQLGKYLGREPIFENEEGNDAYLNDASYAQEVFGYPAVSANTLIRWQAEWLIDGGRSLGKPTHFEERKGTY